jgi:UDP-galactopyranose mutase
MKKYHIIGAGLTGAVIASQLPNSIIYEKENIGGLCRDNANYQEFVHIFHTEDYEIWDFINNFTEVKPFKHFVKTYIKGTLKPWVPSIMTDRVIDEQMKNYGLKMWRSEPPEEALKRVKPNTGSLFGNEYQGIPNFTMLFENLLEGKTIIIQQIKDGDLEGNIILTGAIDEYFNYCYGKLPWRGMKSCHCESEQGLEVPVINFSDDFPFVRMIDYQRLGYGNYIGFEFPSDDNFYPINTEESQELFKKYKKLADEKGIILAGRLATYTYLDMDDCIKQALEIVNNL